MRGYLMRAAPWMLAATVLSPAAAAQTVIEGRPAQALRCAAYIGMAGQYGYAEGRLTAGERAVMAGWSARVLGAWLPLDAAGRLGAYGAALGEIDSRRQAADLIARHGEWCLRAFTAAPL